MPIQRFFRTKAVLSLCTINASLFLLKNPALFCAISVLMVLDAWARKGLHRSIDVGRMCAFKYHYREGGGARSSVATRSAPSCSIDADSDPQHGMAHLYGSLPQPKPKRPFTRPGFYTEAATRSSPAHHLNQPPSEHKDSLLSRVLLTVLCRALSHQMRLEGQDVRVPMLCCYDDFVRVAKCIMGLGRTPEQQERLIRRALNSAIPGGSGT